MEVDAPNEAQFDACAAELRAYRHARRGYVTAREFGEVVFMKRQASAASGSRGWDGAGRRAAVGSFHVLGRAVAAVFALLAACVVVVALCVAIYIAIAAAVLRLPLRRGPRRSAVRTANRARGR